MIHTRRTVATAIFMILAVYSVCLAQYDSSYYIVDTGQQQCYSNTGPIAAPAAGQAFHGQDAQHQGNQPQYVDNGDGTISDPVTGLMWVKARGSKVSWEKALADAATCAVGGHHDWRMPTIKELYSLIDFNGKSGATAATSVAYLNTNHFGFAFGNTAIGERLIDCQDWSATTYVHLTMNGDSTAFGVNFADGRIKGYPKKRLPSGDRNQLYVRYVRGNTHYGVNNFIDNHDSTVTDRATGLMWSVPDSRGGMDWQAALAWVQAKNASGYLGYGDWRLPNAKELQSIIDYTRSPSTTASAAIDPLFLVSGLGGGEYPFYWTSTTHREGPPSSPGGEMAAYLCFGRGLGWMPQPPTSSNYVLLDVHGAGAQRSDPKTGNPANYPYGNGPQGDVIRIFNHVRLVRGGNLFVPVELSSLRATLLPDLRRVSIEWTTESETNNLGFFVQRRAGSATAWEELAGSFTEGHGTTSQPQHYACIDQPPTDGTWVYRLRQLDNDGTQQYSHAVSVSLGADARPEEISLDIHPHPVLSSTTIGFTLPHENTVVLIVTDLFGREVARLVDGERRGAGTHRVTFDARELPSGLYLYRLESEGAAVVRKMLLMR